MVEVIELLQSEWNVVIVTFTTDASGESRKAQKLLLACYTYLVCPDCFSHQVWHFCPENCMGWFFWKVNLVVRDYFKVETIFIDFSKAACELITWLRSKTYVLAQLQEVQVHSGKTPLSVIRAALTRWTAHYLAFSWLLALQHPLKSLVNHDAMADPDKHILNPSGGSVANRRKANEMIAIIENPAFWHALARYESK